jgi:ribosomal protein L20A (L18A)
MILSPPVAFKTTTQVGGSMKAYRVVGKFPNGKITQSFTQDIVAKDEDEARHRVESSFGSRHRVTRRAMKIASIEQIDPSISTAASVISALREGKIPAAAAKPADASEE